MEKKKLFISCPTKGRTEENIKKSIERMHKLAEVIFDQELEIINTYITYINENTPMTANNDIWYLGKSITLMSEADYFIGVDRNSHFWPDCNIEVDISYRYNIPNTLFDVNQIMSEEEFKTVMAALSSDRCHPRRYR